MISVQTVIEGIRNELGIKVGVFQKIQDISSLMSTKTPQFQEKKAEKNEVKHGYPLRKNLKFVGTL